MNAAVPDGASRGRRLRALGITPLHLRMARAPDVQGVAGPVAEPSEAPVTAAVTVPPPVRRGIRRLALQADSAERHDPAVNKMYADLSAAVAKAGLQPVRVCDVAADASAAVMIFGALPPPAGVPEARILRTDALAVLHADRGRKRQLWERLLALGRGAGD